MRLLKGALICVLLQTTGVMAQQSDRSWWSWPESGTAVIRGQVTAAGTGQPLSRADVRLTGRARTLALIADEHGWFEFADLPAGRYGITAARGGYLTSSHGQSHPADPPRHIEVGNGEVRSGVNLALPRAGVIAVKVTDEFGAPIEGAFVQVQQVRLSHGHTELAPTMSDRQRNHASDDRGEIRYYDLPPGEYYVSATLGGLHRRLSDRDRAAQLERLQTFHPGTVNLNDAEPVALGFGQEVSVGISIARTRVARVRGRVLREDGSVARPFGVSMTPLTSGRFNAAPLHSVSTGDEFEIVNVLPGEYRIEYRSDPTDPLANEVAALTVSVAGFDLTGLVLTARPAGTLKGRLGVDRGVTPETWSEHDFVPTISLQNGVTYELRPQPDGTFALRGLTGQSAGWGGKGHDRYLKAVMRGGRDVTDLPIDFKAGSTVDDIVVVLTRDHTHVSGSVRDAGDRRVSDFVVVIFTEDRRRWTRASRYIATTGADRDGRFAVAGLPPGRYLAAAVNASRSRELDPALRESDMLERLSKGALPVTLSAGGTAAITLRLAGR